MSNDYRYTYQTGDEPILGCAIEHGLGHGGFGEVYKVRNAAGKAFAMKLVLRGEVRELRGAELVLQVKSPYLVDLFDIQRDEKARLLLLMELVEGPTLREHLDRHGGPLDLTEAARILEGMLKGLAALHERGLIHRDLKPQNVFLESDLVKVGDHGLVKVLADSDTQQMSGRLGTVTYAAPETLEDRCGPESDLWAAGVVFYEMLTAHRPFETETEAALLVRIREAEPDLSLVPTVMHTFMRIALAKSPEDRFRSAREMAEALSQALSGQPQGEEHATVPRPEITVYPPRAEAAASDPMRHVGSPLAFLLALGLGTALFLTCLAWPPGWNWVIANPGKLVFLSALEWALLGPAIFGMWRKGILWIGVGVLAGALANLALAQPGALLIATVIWWFGDWTWYEVWTGCMVGVGATAPLLAAHGLARRP